jgi:hypothetical protein
MTQKVNYTEELNDSRIYFEFSLDAPDDAQALVSNLLTWLGAPAEQADPAPAKTAEPAPKKAEAPAEAPAEAEKPKAAPQRKRRSKAEIEAEKQRLANGADPNTDAMLGEDTASADAPSVEEVIDAAKVWMANGGSGAALRKILLANGADAEAEHPAISQLDAKGRTGAMAKFMESPDAG